MESLYVGAKLVKAYDAAHFKHPEFFQVLARHQNYHYLVRVSSGTMNINAPAISGSDPGAVPGVSTNHPSFEDRWGRNRIDERLKRLALFRLSATVIGENCTIANDNRAPAMAVAA